MYKRVKDKHEDQRKRYREYAEIYVDDKAEALTVDPDDYIQGSRCTSLRPPSCTCCRPTASSGAARWTEAP